MESQFGLVKMIVAGGDGCNSSVAKQMKRIVPSLRALAEKAPSIRRSFQRSTTVFDLGSRTKSSNTGQLSAPPERFVRTNWCVLADRRHSRQIPRIRMQR